MKILLVDDSELMRMVMKKNLRTDAFNPVIVEAADGLDALRKVSIENPDFILSDSNMPHMSGLDLLRSLRQVQNTTPFGFFTSQASPQFVQEANRLGAAFIHPKPYSPTQLIADIENAVSR